VRRQVRVGEIGRAYPFGVCPRGADAEAPGRGLLPGGTQVLGDLLALAKEGRISTAPTNRLELQEEIVPAEDVNSLSCCDWHSKFVRLRRQAGSVTEVGLLPGERASASRHGQETHRGE